MYSYSSHVARGLSAVALAGLLGACTVTTRAPLPAFMGAARTTLLLDMTDASDGANAMLAQAALGNSDFRARFKVVDRSTLEVLLRDQKLAAVGLLNESTVATLGKQAGINTMMKSNLNYLQVKSNQGGTAKYGYYTYYTGEAEVSLALLDVESGQVIATATGKGSGYDQNSSGAALRTKTLREAIEKAIDNLVRAYAAQTAS